MMASNDGQRSMRPWYLWYLRHVSLLGTLLGVSAVAAPVVPPRLPPAASRAVDFVKDVQPILAASCVSCHGTEKQTSGYRLDARSVALKGGDLGKPPIVPGDSAASPLIHFVSGLDPDLKMPAKGEMLTAEQDGILRAWIDQGAHWPNEVGVKLDDPKDWW